MLSEDKSCFTVPGQTFCIFWLWLACLLEPVMGPLSFFIFIFETQTTLFGEKISGTQPKWTKIYSLKHLHVPIRMPLLSESPFLMRRGKKWGNKEVKNKKVYKRKNILYAVAFKNLKGVKFLLGKVLSIYNLTMYLECLSPSLFCFKNQIFNIFPT